jgi:hypothetical protein
MIWCGAAAVGFPTVQWLLDIVCTVDWAKMLNIVIAVQIWLVVCVRLVTIYVGFIKGPRHRAS